MSKALDQTPRELLDVLHQRYVDTQARAEQAVRDNHIAWREYTDEWNRQRDKP